MILPTTDIQNTQKDTLVRDLIKAGIKSIFITPYNYSEVLADESIDDFNYWWDLYASNLLIPIHNIQEVEDDSEDTAYNFSKLGFNYKLYDGNTRIRIKATLTNENYKRILTLNGQLGYSMYYVDHNNNMYGFKANNGAFYGFELSQISVEKKNITELVDFTTMYFEFAEETELSGVKLNPLQNRYIGKLSFNPERIFTKEISITLNSVSPLVIDMSVKYGNVDISDLTNDDININDNVKGDIDTTLLQYTGDSYLVQGLTESLTTGTIYISNQKYIGCAKYVVRDNILPTGLNLVTEDGLNNIVTEDGLNNIITE